MQQTGERHKKKIANLKDLNNQLMQDLLQEHRASNKIIDEAMSEARKLSSEALEMMRETNLQMIKVDERIISKHNRMSAKIREERLFQSRESDRLRRKLGDTIQKLHREQEASIKLTTAKIQQAVSRCQNQNDYLINETEGSKHNLAEASF